MGIKIITDSVADIPEKLIKELDIKALPLLVNFEDNSYKDGIDIKSKDFFEKLCKSKKLPSTSQVTPGEFIKEFEKVLKENREAIVITMSSNLSGTYNSAVAAKEFLETDKIDIFDSKMVTLPQALTVIKAARLAKKGHGKDEIMEQLFYIRDNMKVKFIIGDLEYLKRGGRLSSSEAVMGKLLNIKPILTMRDGNLEYEDKVRGNKKAFRWIVNWIKDEDVDLSNRTVTLYHSNDSKFLEEFKDAILKNFKIGEIIEGEVGAVVGTHAGPGCVAIAFVK